MKQDNRVLGRKGARELTAQETERIHGAIRTTTVCTFYDGKLDGDPGEC
jgi:hypothetical protein